MRYAIAHDILNSAIEHCMFKNKINTMIFFVERGKECTLHPKQILICMFHGYNNKKKIIAIIILYDLTTAHDERRLPLTGIFFWHNVKLYQGK